MPKDNFSKSVIGNNIVTNLLTAGRLIFDLLPQILLVSLIGIIVSGMGNTRTCVLLISAMGLCYVIKGVFTYLSNKIAHDKAYCTLSDLRLRMIARLKQCSIGFFKEQSVGKLTNVLEHDVEQIETFIAHIRPEILGAVMMPLLLFAVMLWIDYRLALAMLIGIPLMALMMAITKKPTKKAVDKYFSHEARMRRELMEYVRNIAVIKAFGKEETVSERTLETARQYLNNLTQSRLLFGSITALTDIFLSLGVYAVMLIGAWLLSQGTLSMTEFILAIIVAYLFTGALTKFSTMHHFTFMFDAVTASVGAVVNAPLPDTLTNPLVPAENGDIVFDRVSFSYEKDKPVLTDICLTLPAGTTTAVIGASGCGKTTLAQLLMGFWMPKDGEIRINGTPTGALHPAALARLIGSVEQNPWLFDMTVKENIAVGKPDATDEEILAAIRAAGGTDLLERLPQGLNTRVGEDGAKLSGGEQQRLCIARMILKDAPILILDEAMASVDTANESAIRQALDQLAKDKTVITIAHRLNSIRHADQIVVMDKGTIAACGTHEQLMQTCELYRHMVAAQDKVDQWNLKQEESHV